MDSIPSAEMINRLREQFPVGCRIELECIKDHYSKLKPGDRGSVMFIDSLGTIHLRWDSGSTLGLIIGEDRFRRVVE